jgi:uncharacterized ion transporter superfamily protein YfcC
MEFLMAPIKGLVAAAEIIGFVLIVGGAFSMVNRTGAIDAGLKNIILFSRKRPSYRKLTLVMLVTLFSLAGCTFGMSEEVLVFVLITLPLAFSLGYDSILGVAIPFVGAGVGFAGAVLNPFTVGIAQGIAELPPFSGWEYRLLVWLAMTSAAIIFLLIYAKRLDKDPSVSPVYQLDQERDLDKMKVEESVTFDSPRKFILVAFALALILLVYGVNAWEWYILEISGLFLGLGLVAAVIARLPVNEAARSFTDGARDMVYAGLVIALSRGILIIASEGNIIDTILFQLSALVEDFPAVVSVEIMFLVQSLLNFFLPSGSGQAALTMPIMAPLSDLLGITRQTAVLAFQFGDGLSNLIIPTSGVTMGILGIAKIPYQVWLRWIWPLMLILFLLAMLLLMIPAAFFYWGPF